MEGKRDKSVTFIKLEKFEYQMYIPSVSLKYLESLDVLNNIAFHDLINMQCDSVIEALKNEKEIPLDALIIHGDIFL
jgi:glucose-6-phosphate isomerase